MLCVRWMNSTRNGPTSNGSRGAFRAGRRFGQIVFHQLGAGQRQCEPCAVDRRVDFFQQIGQAADVVFMAVRQQNGSARGAVFADIVQVWDDNVHAQHFGVGRT